jgi:hypothetical protein
MCKCLCSILYCIPLDICPGVILLEHMVGLLLVFWETSILISKVVALNSHQHCGSVPFPRVFTGSCLCHWCYWFHFEMRWNHIVILWFAFSLCLRMLNISSCIYWPFIFLLLWIICSVHLSIYLVGCWVFTGLGFSVFYILWLLNSCQMYS